MFLSRREKSLVNVLMFLKEVLNLMIAGVALSQSVAVEESNQAPAGLQGQKLVGRGCTQARGVGGMLLLGKTKEWQKNVLELVKMGVVRKM